MKVWQIIGAVFAMSLVALSVVFAYKITTKTQSNKNAIVDSSTFHRLELESKSEQFKESAINKLAVIKPEHYKPADSVILSWDLVDPEFRKNVVLMLEFDSLDRFQVACLDDFLYQNGIEHNKTNDNRLKIRLKTKELDVAQKIVDRLATYDLFATLQVLREPKPY